MRPVRLALAGGGLVISTALGVAAYTAHVINGIQVRRWEDRYTFSPWELAVPHEDVSFTADDGVTLRGWFMRCPGARTCVIGCAGHRGAKHELLGIGSGLWRAGNHVLLFDFRGSGESEIVPSSLAYHEVLDARAAVRWTQSELNDVEIGIIGYSMGAAVALLVAAEDPTIRAVVADSSFSTMRDVIIHAYRRHHVPGPALAVLTDWWQRLRYGYSFADVRPLDAIGRIAPRPVLLIHGDRDAIVPLVEARQLYAAAGQPKELWIVEDTPHCGAYFVDRGAYVDRVAAFFAESF
ncbi:MAG: alpha/beta hydrolase [Chloroflexota bacterium]